MSEECSTLLRGCWFGSKKLLFRKNLDENFNAVERVRWGWVFFISCLQNDFRKDPQVEPKFCRSLLTRKFVDVAPIGVVINIWNLS